MDYRLLITDVTVYGDLRCVAGWDLDRSEMIRPEPSPGAFWPASKVGPDREYAPGHIVKLAATAPKPPTQYPHLTEDRVVVGDVVVEKKLNASEFTASLKQVGVTKPASLFEKPVEFANGKPFVPVDTEAPSLRAVNISAKGLKFFEYEFDGKKQIRCHMTIGSTTANISVTALDLRESYTGSGIAIVKQKFADADQIHVRVGLARTFPAMPNRCYMQVNGVYRL